MTFIGWIRSLFPGYIAPPTPEKLRAVVRKIVERCPVCGLNLDGHAYAELATVFAGDVTEPLAEHAAANVEWATLLSFHEWNPNADIVEYDAMKCNLHEELGLIRILFRAELWADDELQDCRRLNLEESRLLVELIADRWRSL